MIALSLLCIHFNLSHRSKLIYFLQINQKINLNQLFSIKDKTGDDGTDAVASLYDVCCKGYLDLAEFILDKTYNVFD